MGLCQEIGSPHLAAPPVGATDQPSLDLLKAADRYAALCKVGEAMDVTPMVEHWGHSKCVRRLGEAVMVAMESHVPRACVLPDVFHMYKGGSDFSGIKLLGKAFPILHVNDYPAHDRATIKDAQRVYPGDGVAPLKELIRDLRASGFRGMISLELFNPEYWKQDPALVAKTGLEKLRAIVRASA
jgi:2-keto-myo-inositol isomerase